MDIEELLNLLQTRGTDYRKIHDEIISRCARIGMKNTIVAISCLHSKTRFIAYGSDLGWEQVSEGDAQWHRLFGIAVGQTKADVIQIDLSELDERMLISPRIIIKGGTDNLRFGFDMRTVGIFIRDFCFRAIQRQRAMLRRAFIEAKVGSDDIGTFCYRLLNETLPPMIDAQAMSIFVIDKRNGELRLRGQSPRRNDKRHLSDITVPPRSRSWVRDCFAKTVPIAEYDQLGMLKRGRTSEVSEAQCFSRLYWPIQLQFRSRIEAQRRLRDKIYGVMRISNILSCSGEKFRPFHAFDGFTIEFVSESLFNLIGSYVDRDVEGFDRDLAFHAAKTPTIGCMRNIKLAAQLMFEPSEVGFLEVRPGSVPRQFEINESGVFERKELIRVFTNAYAFALDLASQVERANITEELYPDSGRRVEKLFADVIQKVINLVPLIQVSTPGQHSNDKQRVSINRIFDLELPPPVIGETGALTSVFKNIVENSIKYSKRGKECTIDFSWVDDGSHIRVIVRDNGIGIPDEDAERIFTRGVRSDRAKDHCVRGNGLGLAYCSRVLRSFGGGIVAKPQVDGLAIEIRLKKAT